MKYVVSVGGGIASTLLLPHVLIEVMKINKNDIDFVMCRLPNEDRDVFKLVGAVENRYDIKVKMIGLNKTPFDIFNEVGFLGNSRIDPCSKALKRDIMKNYVISSHHQGSTTIVLGINHEEIDRELSITKNWVKNGYDVMFPLIDFPEYNRENQMKMCLEMVGFIPRLYLMGFSHNNCGGACIKAGMQSWARLWFFLPTVYMQWANDENDFRLKYGDFTILRETVNGEKRKLTLLQFADRLNGANFNAGKESDIIAKFRAIEMSDYYKSLTGDSACNFCDAGG